MKKITLLMFAMLAWAGIATAQNVVLDNTHGLPGTSVTLDGGHAQYQWTSEQFTAPENFKVLRLRFLANSNNESPAGYPCIALAEFYLYDANGEKVALETSMFSSNATETVEGSMEQICNGVESGSINKYDWYWHSYWSTNIGDYHYLELAVPEAADLSTFKFGYTSRQHNGTPSKMLVTMGASTEDVASQQYVYMVENYYLPAAITEAEAVITKVTGNLDVIGSYKTEDVTEAQQILAAASGATGDDAVNYYNQLVAFQNKVIYPEVGKVYHIECPLFYGKQTVHKGLYNNNGTPGWTTLADNDNNFLWTVEATANGLVLKNDGNGKYIQGKSNNNNPWTFSDTMDGLEFTLIPMGSGECAIKITGRHLHANNHNGGNNPSGNIVSWETNSNNSASAWKFLEVEITDEFELAQAKNNLSAAIAQAESMVEYDNYTWQTENPDAPYYITCPQEHNSLNPGSPDGQGIAALVDGNPATFMHSAWKNNPGGTHYILVDLGDGNSLNDLRIDYISRSGANADFIKEVTVYGSNNGSEFNQIAVTTGYPQSAGQSFRVIVENETAYRYFRFDMTKQNFFHAAEFIVGTAVPKESTRNTNLASLIAAGNTTLNSNSLSEINAAAEKITNYVAVLTATDALLANIAECQTFPLGDGLGEYSSSNANYEAEFMAIVDFANNVSTETTVADIEAKNNELNAIKASFSINQPADGSYLRIKAVKEWITEQPYLSSVNSTVKTKRAAFVNTADETTIFYYKDKSLYAVNTAAYLGNSADNGIFAGYTADNAATDIVFAAAETGLIGAYNVIFNNGGRYMYVQPGLYTDAGTSANLNGYSFNLEAVSAEDVAKLPTHTLTVSAAKYSTLYLGYAVALPEGVKAYVVEGINNETGYATLAAVEGVLPANTGFILQAEQGSYTFKRPTVGEGRATIASNMLKGTVEATKIEVGTATPYVLGLDANSVVGLYQAKVTDGKFLNNANKAYLLLDAAQSSNTYGYRFDGENTTGIETIETSAQDNVIYDLTGRRVEKAVKGLYIVNGKKVLVK